MNNLSESINENTPSIKDINKELNRLLNKDNPTGEEIGQLILMDSLMALKTVKNDSLKTILNDIANENYKHNKSITPEQEQLLINKLNTDKDMKQYGEYEQLLEWLINEPIFLEIFMPLKEKGKLRNIIPNSPATHTLKGIFETAGTKRDLKASKNTKMGIKETMNGTIFYTYDCNGEAFEISIKDHNKVLTRQDKNTRKIFNFILEKYNDQKSDYLYFNLNEIVERGIYKNKDTARKGMDKSISKLMMIQVTGTIRKGSKTTPISRHPLIMGLNFKGKYIQVKPELYNYLCRYYTILPAWSDKLDSKAYSIIDYIYYRARQELKSVTTLGSFNINLRTLNDHLGQPEPKDTNYHSQLIINPILKAIKEINEIQQEYKKNNIDIINLNITSMNDDYKNTNDFLNGYLKIELDDKTIKYFKEIDEKFTKKKENNTKRIEGINRKKS